MQLPNELKFLEDILAEDAELFRSADWLESDFDKNIWHYNFGYKSGSKVLDWNVPLSDGSMLTDSKNKILLKSLKHWLIASTTMSLNYKKYRHQLTLSVESQKNLFAATVRLIDYFLLNSKDYELCKYSLGIITEDDLKYLLNKVCSNKSVTEGIFEWSIRLSDFVKDLISKTDSSDIDCFLKTNPDFNYIDDDLMMETSVNLTQDEIILGRAALMLNNLMYKDGTTYRIHTMKISNIIYESSVYIKSALKQNIEVFDVVQGNACINREMKRVKVTTKEDDLLSISNYLLFRKGLLKLNCLNILELPAPPSKSIHAISEYAPEVQSIPGRFRTLPCDIVFKALKDAIDFHIEFGDMLVESYCNLITLAAIKGKSLNSLTRREFIREISPELRTLGVRKLGLSCKLKDIHPCNIRKQEAAIFFEQLRSNLGLLELIHVYYGAVKIVTGVLSARRDGELASLIAGSCLDDTERWIVFEAEKSTKGLMGLRQSIARPIDPLAVDMLKNLTKIQTHMIKYGYLKDYQCVFCPPKLNGTTAIATDMKSSGDRPVDLFCDYFQVGTNLNGERYYFRQHQLRRFFAVLFFFSSTYGGIDTLQYMLGHTDPEHVWHYITESTTGSVLRGAKAQFVAESLHHGVAEYKELSEFVTERFGTTEFSVIDVDELEYYIETLLEENKVTIEPEFFIDHNKQKMRVIVKVIENIGK